MKQKQVFVVATAMLVLLVGAAAPSATPEARLLTASSPPPVCSTTDPIIPSFNDPFYRARPNSFARYVARVTRHKDGFAMDQGGISPTGKIMMYAHQQVCTVKRDHHVDANAEGQMIAYLQYLGTTPEPEYPLARGEIGYLLVERDGKGPENSTYATLWLYNGMGERLAAWPYALCHANQKHGNDPTHVFGWLSDTESKNCDGKDVDRFRKWLEVHHDDFPHDHDPNPLLDPRRVSRLHNELPWFSCQEGCCHVVE
jgi:hypothetical protein